MQEKWSTTRLEDIAAKIAIGPFGSRMKSDCYVKSGVPVIRGTNLTGGKSFTGDWVFVSEQTADDLGNCCVSANDLVFPHRGSIGEVGIVTDEFPRYVMSSSLMKLTCDTTRAVPSYVYYFFKSAQGRYELLKNASQVGTPGIGQPLSSLKGIEIPLPPLPEQRAIAHILGTLDDKIELNRRMNETLEAMARSLFKSWFVDFEPVREKAEGRDTGLPREIADLFPDSFEDSELGEVPKGWKVRTIDDLAEVVGGSTPSTKDPLFWENGQHCWATPKDLSALSTPVLLETERKVTNAGVNQISSGLMPRGTVLLSSRAPIGYLAIAEVPVAINQGFIAMKARKSISNLFLLRWAEWAHEDILSRANGSTFQEISKSNFRPIPVVKPPSEVFVIFDKMAHPLYERMVTNERESRTLAAQRDALIPKLLSGEVRVNEGEKNLSRESQ